MSKLKIERQEETYAKLGGIIGIPGPSKASIRKHGIILLLAGLASTTFLVVVSWTTFFGDYCLNLRSRAIGACLQLSSIISAVTCLSSFATISFLGIGLVETITTSPWNEVQGPRPFAILIATWIFFVGVLCLLINQAFGA